MSKKVLIVGGSTKGTYAQALADAMTDADKTLIDLTSHPRLVRPPVEFEVKRVGANRNLPCPCGSGRKFKKCCFNNIDPVTIEP